MITTAPFHGFFRPASAAGSGSPGGVLGCQLWHDADQETGFTNDQEMSTAQDFSGNGRHSTGVVWNLVKPKYRSTDGPNSKPAFRMGLIGGTDPGGYFQCATGFPQNGSFTAGHAFTVVKLDAEPPTANNRSGPVFGDWGGSGIGEFYPFRTDGIVYNGFGSSTRYTTTNPTTSLTTWHVLELRSASGNWSQRINRATSGNDFFESLTNTVGWATSGKIGHRVLSGQSNLMGLIAEVIFFGHILNSTEIGQIYSYLNTKYGFSL